MFAQLEPQPELLVTFTQKNVKLYLNDKYWGIFSRSTLIKPIPRGELRIKVECEGFFADSITFEINRSIRYSHNFKLRSTSSGLLKIKSELMVFVEVDGDNLGRNRPEGFVLSAGARNLKLTRKGYVPYEELIDVTEGEEIIRDINLESKSMNEALYRSAVLPGWGQKYSDRDPTFVQYSNIGAIASIAGVQLMYSYYTSQWNKSYDNYINASTVENVDKYRKEVDKYHASMEGMIKARNVTIALFIFTYSYNLLDIIVNDPSITAKNEIEIKNKNSPNHNIALSFKNGQPQIGYQLTF
ncbi:MAG: PEGA domain-containing protein [Bacteroidetes bacterium]|nr:PEGA domain-containing protein [Bacteroidota bacterium]